MTSNLSDMTGSPVSTRPGIVLALPEGELDAIGGELRGAGFGVLSAHRPEDLSALSTSAEPFTVAVVDATQAPADAVRAVEELRRFGASFSTLYVADASSFDALDAAGMASTDELVLRPISAESIRWRVEAMVVRSTADGEHGEVDSGVAGQALHQLNAGSPILAVFNPKGGVGKTTIATHLAASLQVRKGQRVLLVDADTVTGHVALSLGIRAPRGVADDWSDDPGEAPEPILSLATEHSSGVRVATLTADPLALPNLSPDRVTDLLVEARSGVDVVLVDLHPSYSDLNLAIFAAATRILVPVTPDLPAMRAAMQLGRVASELGIRDRLSLVVNRANSGVSVADIEETTDLKSIAEIRSAGMLLVRAGNLGKTLVEQFPREKVTSEFDHLSDRVMALVGIVGPARSSVTARPRRVAALLGARVSAT